MASNEAKNSPTADYYTLGQSKVSIVTSTKYLGVTIQSDLIFTKHIESKTTKARQILGLIKRTLYNAPEKAKLLANTSMCRPIIGYASSVWDLYQKKNIQGIESVQNSAIRFISILKGHASITEARELLNLQTLEK